MKLEILSKTRMRDRSGAIVTRYGCAILTDDEAEPPGSRPAAVNLTILGEDLGDKDVGGIVEIA